MTKRKPVSETAAIDAAIARAKQGQGRQLAMLIKAIPVDDLAHVFGSIGPSYADWSEAWWMVDLTIKCANARRKGREDFRREWAKTCKRLRQERLAEEKAARDEIDQRNAAETNAALAATIERSKRVLEPA